MDDYKNNNLIFKRKRFNLYSSIGNLELALKKFPAEDECVKLISPRYGWSSCSLIIFLAEKEIIKNLFITTLRIGKKEIQAIESLMLSKRILNCYFVTSSLLKENKKGAKDYGYDKYIEDVCSRNNIEIRYKDNHSKILLAETENNYYTIETSSNFNENPKIEQFNIENNKKVFKYYKKLLFDN